MTSSKRKVQTFRSVCLHVAVGAALGYGAAFIIQQFMPFSIWFGNIGIILGFVIWLVRANEESIRLASSERTDAVDPTRTSSEIPVAFRKRLARFLHCDDNELRTPRPTPKSAMTLQSNVQIGDYHGPKSASFIRSILEHIRQLVRGSMSESRSRLGHITWEAARTVAIATGVTFGILSVILFGFWFQPGWANGWPLPKHTVWAFGMTAIVAAQFILLSTAVSILLSYFAEQKIKKAFLGWSLFLSAMFLVVAVTVIVFPILYQFLRTAIEEVWL